MATQQTTKISLKLLIDSKNQKVLFAEANKEFVDFLFYLLAIPIGTIVRLLSKTDMVGCLGKLYKSIENLSESYIQANNAKETVLNPKTQLLASQLPLLISNAESNNAPKIYMCPSYHMHSSHSNLAVCPQCNQYMSVEIPYVTPKIQSDSSSSGNSSGGFVKGLVTYMVMDDLTVEPMSTISGITLLNKFHIKEVGSLEEKVVYMTMTEGLKLLKASLQCKTVLSTVFLNGAKTSKP